MKAHRRILDTMHYILIFENVISFLHDISVFVRSFRYGIQLTDIEINTLGTKLAKVKKNRRKVKYEGGEGRRKKEAKVGEGLNTSRSYLLSYVVGFRLLDDPVVL